MTSDERHMTLCPTRKHHFKIRDGIFMPNAASLVFVKVYVHLPTPEFSRVLYSSPEFSRIGALCSDFPHFAGGIFDVLIIVARKNRGATIFL
jgi:hypothetical protein